MGTASPVAASRHDVVSSLWLIPRAATIVFILGCCSLFLAWIADWLNESHSKRFKLVESKSYLLRSPAAQSTPLLSGYDFEKFYFTWLPILAASLASIGLHQMPRPSSPPAWWCGIKRRLIKFALFQLWPSRFWFWFCGGMNVAEAFFVLCYLFLNAWYFKVYYIYYKVEVIAALDSGLYMPGSYNLMMLEKMSLTFGIMLWVNFWLLFFPLPHCGFLTALLGLPFERIIRYHRWLGHVTMLIITVHSLGYYIYWASVQVPFWHQFADWSGRSFINNLGGSIAFFAGLVLWITSAEWCRRRFFEVFYRCHIICFILLILFFQIHYYYAWTMLFPGLCIYFADVALRAGQMNNLTPLHFQNMSKEDTVLTVQMTTDKDFNATAKQDIFLQIPQIDRFAWHPFTIMQHKRQPDGTGLLTMQIKRYSDWTKELFVRSQVKGQQLRGKITGPFDVPIQKRNWEECSTAVMIGGGIGAVPLLAMLDDLVPRMEEGQAGILRKVVFVWLSHTGDEFSIMDPSLLELARQQDWLDIHLHITRKPVFSLNLPSLSSSAQSTPDKMAGSDPKLLAALPADRNTDRAAEEVGPLDMQPLAESAWGWRPKSVQPKFCGGLVEAVVLILTFAGALFATVLTAGYYAEWARTTAGEPPESMGWVYGILIILAQVSGALGLPYALCIFPLHAFRHFFNRTPMKYSLGEGLVPALNLDPMMPQLHVSRPDLWTLLNNVVAEDCPGQAGYGVFVAGPPPMWDSLQKMVQVKPASIKRMFLFALAKLYRQLRGRYLSEIMLLVQAMRRGGVDIRTHQEAGWL